MSIRQDAPVAMIQAVRAVVHQNLKPEHALDLDQTLESQFEPT
jgi:hypothetical protein